MEILTLGGGARVGSFKKLLRQSGRGETRQVIRKSILPTGGGGGVGERIKGITF